MFIGCGPGRVKNRLGLGCRFGLIAPFFRIAGLLLFPPAPIPLRSFRLSQFITADSAPCFFNAALKAAEMTGCNAVKVQRIEGIGVAVVIGFEPVKDTIGDNRALEFQASRVHGGKKIDFGMTNSRVYARIMNRFHGSIPRYVGCWVQQRGRSKALRPH